MDDNKDIQKVHIVEDTSREGDITLIFSKASTIIRNFYSKPIILNPEKNYKLGMFNLETYYSFGNIDSSNNQFKYTSDGGTNWTTLTITGGAYSLEALNTEVQRLMRINGHWDSTNEEYYINIKPNNSTLKSIIEITNSNYQVDFTIGNSPRNIL